MISSPGDVSCSLGLTRGAMDSLGIATRTTGTASGCLVLCSLCRTGDAQADVHAARIVGVRLWRRRRGKWDDVEGALSTCWKRRGRGTGARDAAVALVRARRAAYSSAPRSQRGRVAPCCTLSPCPARARAILPDGRAPKLRGCGLPLHGGRSRRSAMRREDVSALRPPCLGARRVVTVAPLARICPGSCTTPIACVRRMLGPPVSRFDMYIVPQNIPFCLQIKHNLFVWMYYL